MQTLNFCTWILGENQNYREWVFCIYSCFCLGLLFGFYGRSSIYLPGGKLSQNASSMHPPMWDFKVHGTARINAVFRDLYHLELWIPREKALEIAKNMLQFVRAYAYEAFLSLQKKKMNMFPMVPKLHLIHEISFTMTHQASKACWVYNPIAETCSMDEDFVGRCAVLSRSVSPRLNALRSLQRYLAQIQMTWLHWNIEKVWWVVWGVLEVSRVDHSA